MKEYTYCPFHEKHEVYDGYRKCPWFNKKVNILANDYNEEPIHILSTGKWRENVSDQRMGLI